MNLPDQGPLGEVPLALLLAATHAPFHQLQLTCGAGLHCYNNRLWQGCWEGRRKLNGHWKFILGPHTVPLMDVVVVEVVIIVVIV